MPVVLTKTTYLEMLAPPSVSVSPPRNDLQVLRLHSPGVDEYRRLYRGVGGQLNWVDRLLMADEELNSILANEQVEVHVLQVDRQTAGYCELDLRIPDQVEFAYFGLFPEFVGQGLGKYFLNWTLHHAWSHQPKRVWVHTCDLDHAAALPNYLRAGFQIYAERMIEQIVPDVI